MTRNAVSIRSLLLLTFAANLVACSGSLSEEPVPSTDGAFKPATSTNSPGLGTGKVLETMDAAGYTYVLVDLGSTQIWAAGPITPVQVGDTVHLPQGMPMKDFESTSLNRTFEEIYFVGAIQTGDAAVMGAIASAHGSMGDATSATDSQSFDLEGIEKAEGGLTIAEVYANRQDLASKEVLIRGRVVKFNPEIMDRNWLHIQDGSGEAGTNDITVTTADQAEVGSVVTIRGTLTLDKDFGFGYAYDVLIEEATVTAE